MHSILGPERSRGRIPFALLLFVMGCGSASPVSTTSVPESVTPEQSPVASRLESGPSGDDESLAVVAPPTVETEMPSGPLVQIDGTAWFGCVRHRDGRVGCWGRGWDGRLGVGDRIGSDSIRWVPGVQGATELDVSGEGACAIVGDGRVQCWGHGDLQPVFVEGLSQVRSMARNHHFFCAVLADGTAQCGPSVHEARQVITGLTQIQQVVTRYKAPCFLLTDGSTECAALQENGERRRPTSTTAPVSAISRLSASDAHLCAMREGGVVSCWGSNRFGVCGGRCDFDEAVDVPLAGPAHGVAAGESSSCALLSGGRVQCWGQAAGVAMGGGPRDIGLVDIPLPAAATAVSAGCAALENGRVRCWGRQYRHQPVSAAIDEVVAVGAGDSLACAVRSNGALHCWGRSGRWRSNTPVEIAGVEGGLAVDVTERGRVCVRTASAVLCADNPGDSFEASVESPAEWMAASLTQTCTRQGSRVRCAALRDSDAITLHMTDVVHADVRRNHVCVVRRNGQVACRGERYHGDYDRPEPTRLTPIRGTRRMEEVAAGLSFACARQQGGRVYCWGEAAATGRASTRPHTGIENVNGREVRSEYVQYHPSPAPVDGLSGAVALDAERSDVCAATSSGDVFCWGHHYQDVGDLERSFLPVSLGTRDAVDVAVGSSFACARQQDGHVVCWGSNGSGELGDGNGPGPGVTFEVPWSDGAEG